VYCVSERTGNAVEVIYIGKSKDLRNRIYKNHLIGSRRFSTLKRKIIQSEGFSNDADVENYLRERCAVQFVIIEDELERNFFEHFAIAIFRPKFND
jgi:excinuclease UvrABC nuclease subunit